MVEVNKIKYYLNDPLMKRIVELKERGYADKVNSITRLSTMRTPLRTTSASFFDITADVATNVIEPNSESVDLEGPTWRMAARSYASKTYENLDATRKAGLWGITMPRRFGGLNLPMTVFSMLSELVRAVSTRCMSSVPPSSRPSTFPASAPVRPCRWTLPNPMPAPTCSTSC